MMQTTRRPYDELRACEDPEKIDELLDTIGILNNPENRRDFLYDVMGIEYTFLANDMTAEEEYAIAKDEFASQEWKDMD